MNATNRQIKRGRQQDGSANPVDVFVGKKIRLRRQTLKLSQTQLANKLGIAFQQIQKYEKGSNRISASRLWDFANVLGVDCNYFYTNMSDKINTSSPRFLINDDATINNTIKEDPFYNEQNIRIIKNISKINSQESKNALETITRGLSKILQSTKNTL